MFVSVSDEEGKEESYWYEETNPTCQGFLMERHWAAYGYKQHIDYELYKEYMVLQSSVHYPHLYICTSRPKFCHLVKIVHLRLEL